MAVDLPTFQALERTSGRVTATLVSTDGVTPIPGSTLTSLTLTLYAILENGTDSIINNRNLQSVLQTNNVTVSEAGELVWAVQPGDTTIVESFLLYERHIALWEWSTASVSGKYEICLNVKNLRRVT